MYSGSYEHDDEALQLIQTSIENVSSGYVNMDSGSYEHDNGAFQLIPTSSW